MQTPKDLGAVAVTQHTPTNHSANYTSNMSRAAIVISRFMTMHPDCVLLAALLCLLLWGAAL